MKNLFVSYGEERVKYIANNGEILINLYNI